MERREFLRQTAAGAAGLMLSETEKEVVDSRLTQKVTCAFKGTALSDLCDQLRSDTGIQLAAGPSVADEKVTLFGEKRPLREVMRQLSRPFGYTWLRSGTPGQYRYELVQDLRSQLLEEELRNRDRNAALLAFEREMERFRPYLDLSPDEALARTKSAPPAEKKRLETLAGVGWGPIQMYFRLSPQQMTALRSGHKLTFSETPEKPDEYPLPQEMARGVLQCNRGWRLIKRDDGGVDWFDGVYAAEGDTPDPKSISLTAVPAVRAQMHLTLSQSELGQFALGGGSGYITPPGKNFPSSRLMQGAEPYVVGTSPGMGPSSSALGAADARLERDPVLRSRVSVRPQPSCHPPPSSDPVGTASLRAPGAEPKVTVADVLEAIHQTTRMPVVADQYTRLFKPDAVSVSNQSLFEALNRVSEPMRLRWNKEGDWLQFRSASYYNDRLKEVPNRLLTRWSVARRQQGLLSLEDLVEIAQLTDAQLDGAEMAECATDCWGLKEWFLVRNGELRPHVRFLAEFTPAQRQEMLSAAGLPFTKMTLAQQQGFLTFALQGDETPLRSLEELAGATLRVDYTMPGWYQWIKVGELRAVRWAVAVDQGRRVLMPPVRERTPEAALRTARKLFPPVTEAMLQAWRRYWPDVSAEMIVPQPEEIAPTELDLVIVYIPSLSTAHSIRWVRTNQSWGQK